MPSQLWGHLYQGIFQNLEGVSLLHLVEYSTKRTCQVKDSFFFSSDWEKELFSTLTRKKPFLLSLWEEKDPFAFSSHIPFFSESKLLEKKGSSQWSHQPDFAPLVRRLHWEEGVSEWAVSRTRTNITPLILGEWQMKIRLEWKKDQWRKSFGSLVCDPGTSLSRRRWANCVALNVAKGRLTPWSQVLSNTRWDNASVRPC
jgi:hypothetical protein